MRSSADNSESLAELFVPDHPISSDECEFVSIF